MSERSALWKKSNWIIQSFHFSFLIFSVEEDRFLRRKKRILLALFLFAAVKRTKSSHPFCPFSSIRVPRLSYDCLSLHFPSGIPKKLETKRGVCLFLEGEPFGLVHKDEEKEMRETSEKTRRVPFQN